MVILRNTGRRALTLLALAGAAFSGPLGAQTPTWDTPASGYVYDAPAQSIRPILGFLGGAVLGTPVVSQAEWVSIAPNLKSAIVESSGSSVWIANLNSASVSNPLAQIAAPQQGFWASDSTSAVVLTADDSLVWLKATGGAPAQQAAWKLNQFSRLSPRGSHARWYLLAADSAADRVLLTTHSGRAWQVWSASRTSAPSLVPFSGEDLAAAFPAQPATVYIADAASHRIVKVTQLDATPSVATVVDSAQYVQNPSGLALSADGSRVSLADRSAKQVRVFDVSNGSLLTELPVDEIADSITAFSSGRYLLNPASGHASNALYILDTANPASIYFVPRGE